MRLLDDLIGAGEQRWRYFEAENSGGLSVDYKLELTRLHHRQIRRLGSVEDATDIDTDLAQGVGGIGAVAHQSAGLCECTIWIACRHVTMRRPLRQLHAPAVKQSAAAD